MSLEEDKKGLIDLILWYRDEWHKKDFGHTEMIEKIQLVTKIEDLDFFEQTVDGWLD